MPKNVLVFALGCLFLLSHRLDSEAQEKPRNGDSSINPFQEKAEEALRRRTLEDITSEDGLPSEGTLKRPDAPRLNDKSSGKDRFTKPIDDRQPNRHRIFTGVLVMRLLEDDPDDDKLRSLKKERCRIAMTEVSARLAEFRGGRSPVTDVLDASTHLAYSLLSLDPDVATHEQILKHSLEVSKDIERFAKLNLQNGTGTMQEFARATYERLTAEILLEELKQQQQKMLPRNPSSQATTGDDSKLDPGLGPGGSVP